MKIQREIDGVLVEIELTRNELLYAYCEYEHMSDCELCLDYAENTDEYLQLSPETQKEFIDSMADYSRGYMDQGDWNVNDALDAAFEDACNEFIEDEEEF